MINKQDIIEKVIKGQYRSGGQGQVPFGTTKGSIVMLGHDPNAEDTVLIHQTPKTKSRAPNGDSLSGGNHFFNQRS